MEHAATTKLSSRGQVVIPEEIRTRLGLEPGVRFVVVGEGDVVVLKALHAPDLSDLEELLDEARRSARDAGLTREEMEAAVREARAEE